VVGYILSWEIFESMSDRLRHDVAMRRPIYLGLFGHAATAFKERDRVKKDVFWESGWLLAVGGHVTTLKV